MANQINGQFGIFEQPHREGRDQQGPYCEVDWEGTRYELRDYAATLNHETGLTWEITEGPSGAKDRLRIRYPYSYDVVPSEDDLVTTWEKFGTLNEVPILDADFQDLSGSAFFGLTKLDKYRIKQALGLDLNSSDPTTSTYPAFLNADNPSKCATVFMIMLAGVTSRTVEQPTIRRTVIVNDQNNFTSDETEPGAVYLTDTLTAWIPSLDNAMFNDELPPNPLESTNPITRIDGVVVNYGWLAHSPHWTQIAFGKWSVVQEWQYGLWSQEQYGGAT